MTQKNLKIDRTVHRITCVMDKELCFEQEHAHSLYFKIRNQANKFTFNHIMNIFARIEYLLWNGWRLQKLAVIMIQLSKQWMKRILFYQMTYQ